MSYSIEQLVHFQCSHCEKWWTIGDAPLDRSYHCPWCGRLQNKDTASTKLKSIFTSLHPYDEIK